MYNILKTVHSYWAFFVLTILFIAILNALIRIISKKSFNSTDLRISLFGLIFSQELLGFEILHRILPIGLQSQGCHGLAGRQNPCPMIMHPPGTHFQMVRGMIPGLPGFVKWSPRGSKDSPVPSDAQGIQKVQRVPGPDRSAKGLQREAKGYP